MTVVLGHCSNGPFAPGVAAEAGSPEVELFIDMGASSATDRVAIVAGEGNDSIAASPAAIDIDASDAAPDDDVFLLHPSSVRVDVHGQDGNDTIDLGQLGSSDHLDGGDGDDRLVGGPGQNELDGGPGVDNLDGGPGADNLDGWSGADQLVGGYGNDDLTGGFGDDSASCGFAGG